MVNGREEKLKSIIFSRSLTEITLGTKEVTLSALLARYLMMVWWVSRFLQNLSNKDTKRKIRQTEFIYIFASKNGSSCSIVNTSDL